MGHADPRHAGASQAAIQPAVLHPSIPHGVPFQLPPKTGIYTRYVHTYPGEPAVEVWKDGKRVDPPPGLVKRADPTKNDCFFRVGDVMDGGAVWKPLLKTIGFDDPGESVLTALLFFLLDLDSQDSFPVLFTFREINGNLSDPWKGRVLFGRSLVVGGTVVPFPQQTDIPDNLQSWLQVKEITDELVWLAGVLDAGAGYMMDVIWGLTGGWELEIAAEVTEKYVARAVLKRAMKYIRPKFLAVAKAYVTGFVKDLVKQAFERVKYMIKINASSALMSKTHGSSANITVDDIRWLQSATELSKHTDLADINWMKCHTAGIEEALGPFWKLFAGISVANGPGSPLGRFIKACFGYIDKFFFDLGLLRVVKMAEGQIGAKMNSMIKKYVAEILTDWTKEVVGSPKGMTEEASDHKIRELTLKKLTDGTLFDLTAKYFEDNWENLVKAALDKAEASLLSSVKNAAKESSGKSDK